MIREAALLLFFPALMAYSAASDLITMRISNRISLALVVGFVVFAVANGMPVKDIGWHLACGAVVLAGTFALFLTGKFGGGDAKLVASTSLWFGFQHAMEYFLLASVFGGLLTVAIIYLRAYPAPGIVTKTPWLLHLHDPRTRVPYGIALAAGALVIYPETTLWAAVAAG
jgi:prepilin peptidase CpaA